MKLENTNQLNVYFRLFTFFTTCALLLLISPPQGTVEAMRVEPLSWVRKAQQAAEDGDHFASSDSIRGAAAEATQQQSKIYFGDDILLWESGLQGDFQTPFLTIPPHLGYLAVDSAEQKIYFMEAYNRWIRRMALDGSNVEEVLSEDALSGYLALLQLSIEDVAEPPGKVGFDAVDKKAYFAVDIEETISLVGTKASTIISVGLDGSVGEVVREVERRISGIAIDDEVNRNLYWFEEEEVEQSLHGFITTVKGINLDNGVKKSYLTGVETYINGFDVDLTTNHIYWIAGVSGATGGIHYTLRRTNLDPGGAVNVGADGGEIVVDLGTIWATELVVDGANRVVYWLQQSYFPEDDKFAFVVYRANLDDANPTAEIVVRTRATDLNHAALSRNLGKVYWNESDKIFTGDWIGSIWGISLDGTEKAQNLSHLDSPGGIAVDMANRKIYWTVPELGLIRQANLDGSNLGTLLTGLNQPEALVINPADGKIYWTEGPRDSINVWSIRRAKLDGTNPEVFYSWDETPEIRGLALFENTIYWTVQENDWDNGRIRAAQMDKDNLIWVAEGLNKPLGVAIDSVNRRIYWTEPSEGTIKRANLDGTLIEIVVRGLVNPRGVAVDALNKKIYWTANESGGNIGLVQRANLDGTGVENIIRETAHSVKYIALGLTKARLTETIYPTGDVSGDFLVNAYDAALILQFSIGLINKFPVDSLFGMAPENAVPRHYKVSVPELTAVAGDRLSVPIAIDYAKGFLAGGVTLKYDAVVLKAERAYLGLNEAYWKANTELDGEVRVAFVSLDVAQDSILDVSQNSILANDTLFIVEFDVLSGAEGKDSPLVLDYVELSNSLSIQKTDGLITVKPRESQLLQNYPNPFNPETWIPYQLSADSDVAILIYNAHGAIVRQLTFGNQPAGLYLTRDKAAHWDGQNSEGELVGSGVYFYVLKSGDFTATRKMLIIK